METHRLVLPGDLNQYGFLFGGRLIAWIDEASWIAACLEHPGHQFVTMGMDKVEFHESVREGTIILIRSERIRTGNTSVTYAVEASDVQANPRIIFSTNITFVSVDEHGKKRRIGS